MIKSESFDAAAKDYDDIFTNSQIGRLQRARVWQYLNEQGFKRGSRVLEINGGTGEDGLFFLRNGFELYFTDLSPKMVEVALGKFEQSSHKALLGSTTLNAKNIGQLSEQGPFDLVFSNFGGLNCLNEKDLEDMMSGLNSCLKPGGRFIAVVMSSCCPNESAYFLLKGSMKKAVRRRAKSIADVEGQKFPVWYYSPKAFAKIFASSFKLMHTRAVGLFIPSSPWEGFFKNKASLLKIANGVENRIGNSATAAYFADHFLIDLKRIS